MGSRQFDCLMSNGMAALSCEDTTAQSLADAHSTALVLCSNAANIGECKTLTQSEFCT